MPLPAMRIFLPLAVPAGILSDTLPPVGSGASTVAPRVASVIESGRS